MGEANIASSCFQHLALGGGAGARASTGWMIYGTPNRNPHYRYTLSVS
jgi:hypothetical protein